MLKIEEICQPIVCTSQNEVELQLLKWHNNIVQQQFYKNPRNGACSNCGLQTKGVLKILSVYLCEFCRLSIDRSMNK